MTISLECYPTLATLLTHAQFFPLHQLQFSNEPGDDFSNCILLHCALAGEPLLDLLLLHFIAKEPFQESTLNQLSAYFQGGKCRIDGRTSVPIVLDDLSRSLRESCDRLLSRGLVCQGVPRLPAVDAAILDFWQAAEIEFFEDSLYLSEQGKQRYLSMETRLMGREIWVTRKVDNLLCTVSSSPVTFLLESVFDREDDEEDDNEVDDAEGDDSEEDDNEVEVDDDSLNRFPPVAYPIIRGCPPELCRIGSIPRWRADWWRSPEPGYFLIRPDTSEEQFGAPQG